MAMSNAHLFDNPRYSDLTVRCAAKEWSLHRNIVCPHSKFFDEACNNDSETAIKVITLDEYAVATVDRMLIYLYTRDYSDGPLDTSRPETATSSASTASSTNNGSLIKHQTGPITPPPEPCFESSPSAKLLVNALVYGLADEHEIVGLKDLARLKFESNAFLEWPIPNFPLIVRGIHESTAEDDAGLRTIVNKVCALHLEDVLASKNLLNMAMQYPELGLGILIEYHNLRCSETTAIETSKSHAEKATQAHANAITQIETLQSDLTTCHNSLSTAQQQTSESDQRTKTATDTLLITRNRLSQCEDLLKRTQLRATAAEASLENLRENVRGLQRCLEKEKARVMQLLQADKDITLAKEEMGGAQSVGGGGGCGSSRSADWLMAAVSKVSGYGCRNCNLPMDFLVWEGTQAVLRCGSCRCRHYLG